MASDAPAVSTIFSHGEEIANWVTHGLAALASIAGGIVLSSLARERGDGWHVVGCTIFAATMVLLYASSAIYHATPARYPVLKKRWKTLDHAAIYLLIAGSYTPFMLVNLRGPWGWSVLAAVWIAALAGIAYELMHKTPVSKLRLCVYAGMGWLVLVAFRPLSEVVPAAGLWLIVLGGVAYTSGIRFYLWRKLRYHHAIWHLFVMLGTTLHYFAVLLYVVPAATGG